MTAVSNSSPLILFSTIGRLHLLRDLFEQILIPAAVYQEVLVAGHDRPRRADLARASWIETQSVTDPTRVNTLLTQMDRGEAEAIVLAEEIGSGIPLLIDDRKGRRFALARGLGVVGCGGVLLVARQRRIIPRVRPLLDELRAAGLRLNQATIERILSAAEE